MGYTMRNLSQAGDQPKELSAGSEALGWYSSRSMACSKLGFRKGNLAAEFTILSSTHLTCTALGSPHVLVLCTFRRAHGWSPNRWEQPKVLSVARPGPVSGLDWGDGVVGAAGSTHVRGRSALDSEIFAGRTRFRFISETPVSSTGLALHRCSRYACMKE